MLRRVISILSGLFLGILIFMIIAVLCRSAFPFPENYEWLNEEDMENYIDGLPDRAFILIVTSHVLGAFLGALIASLISLKHRFTNGIITAAILFTMIIIVNFTFDFPRFYIMLDTLLVAIFGFIGALIGQRRNV